MSKEWSEGTRLPAHQLSNLDLYYSKMFTRCIPQAFTKGFSTKSRSPKTATRNSSALQLLLSSHTDLSSSSVSFYLPSQLLLSHARKPHACSTFTRPNASAIVLAPVHAPGNHASQEDQVWPAFVLLQSRHQLPAPIRIQHGLFPCKHSQPSRLVHAPKHVQPRHHLGITYT